MNTVVSSVPNKVCQNFEMKYSIDSDWIFLEAISEDTHKHSWNVDLQQVYAMIIVCVRVNKSSIKVAAQHIWPNRGLVNNCLFSQLSSAVSEEYEPGVIQFGKACEW